MAVRIRTNGDIVCAALNDKEAGDVYVNDSVHHILCKNKIIVTQPEPQHTISGGLWWWKGQEPKCIIIENFWYE